MSIEQYLSMSDEDEQYLVSLNFGDVIHSPFFRSSIKNTKQKPDTQEDSSIDYIEELDDVLPAPPTYLEEELFEDLSPEDLEIE